MVSATPLNTAFADFCRANHLIAPHERLVVAVSGGVDSMVLLHLLLALKSEWDLELTVAHVNHQLRGDESIGDEEFVRQAAEGSNLPFHCTRVNTLELKHTLGVSKQVAAREARYQFLEQVRQQSRSSHVATGHQADDDAETVLFNAVRGGGIRGLAGIPLSRTAGHIVRPLLFARRQDILSYAQHNNIRFRNDSSNESLGYSRNYIRHSVIPQLTREYGVDVTKSLNRVSSAMKSLGRYLDELVENRIPSIVTFKGSGCVVSISSFLKEPLFLQEEIVLSIVKHLGIEPSAVKIGQIIGLCSGQSGHYLNISGSFVVRKDRDHLVFCEHSDDADFSTTVSIGNSYSFERFAFSLGEPGPVPANFVNDGFIEYIDGDKMKEPLTLRTWKHGDWFVPLGMNGRKKLSDFFNDVRLPSAEKFNIPVFESSQNIVWVCGKRLDQRYRITEQTRNAVKLTFSPITTAVH